MSLPDFWKRGFPLAGVIGMFLFSLFTSAAPARAASMILNGSFSDVGTATSSFSISKDTTLPNWTATPSGNQILDCLVFPGATTNLCGTTAFGGGMSFWVNPGPSPDGGNYVSIDGDAMYATPLTQQMTGLVVGQYYKVTFYQASAQQNGFNGATTEQWKVGFDNQFQTSTLMSTPDHGSVGWSSQTMWFAATTTTATLSFLARGTPNGEPPFVLLDGVSVTAPVPEPETYLLVGLGLIGIPVLARRRRSRPL